MTNKKRTINQELAWTVNNFFEGHEPGKAYTRDSIEYYLIEDGFLDLVVSHVIKRIERKKGIVTGKIEGID